MAHRILVVGGGYAGTLSAIRLARKTRAEDVQVVLADARPWFVERVRLHEDVAGAGPQRRSFASLLAGTRVRLRVGAVEGIDLERRRATFTQEATEEPFDELVLATGSVASTPDIPGIARAWSCATEERAFALRAHLATLDGASVVVVGGGLTGLELATELAESRRDLHVTLVSSGALAALVSPAARAVVRRAFESARIVIREHTRVIAIEDDAIVLSSGEAIASDATVWCGGFEAAPIARSAGLAVDARGRALVDARLRSASHDFVRVIGDAAHVELRLPDGSFGEVRMACASAVPQGAYCADAIAAEQTGRDPRAFSFAHAIACVSLGRRNGLIQRLDPYGVPTQAYVAGRPGAWLKELVCRFAMSSPRLERRGIGYRWFRAPVLPASAASPMLAPKSS